VRDHEPVRRAREAPVGDQRHLLAQALADDRRRDGQHLTHARTARRPLRADHDDIARLNLVREHRRHRRLLAVEHARRPSVFAPLMA